MTMQTLLRMFLTLFIVLALTLSCAFGYIGYTLNHYSIASPTSIIIEKGQGLKEIAAALERSSVIPEKHSFMLILYYYSNYLKHFIIPGEYEFGTGTTPAAALHKLLKGE